MTPENPGGLLTPEATARRLSISRTRAFDLIARGELRSFKTRRTPRILLSPTPTRWITSGITPSRMWTTPNRRRTLRDPVGPYGTKAV